jgi:NADH:ubiquinone oxidoreductase subunit 2 (subunit N)
MMADITLLIPELVLLLLASLALVVDAYSQSPDKLVTYRFVQVSLLITVGLVLAFSPEPSGYAFAGHFISDPMSVFRGKHADGLSWA